MARISTLLLITISFPFNKLVRHFIKSTPLLGVFRHNGVGIYEVVFFFVSREFSPPLVSGLLTD